MYIRFNQNGDPDMVSGGVIEGGYVIPAQFSDVSPWSLKLVEGEVVLNAQWLDTSIWKYGEERPIIIKVPKILTKRGGALKEFLFDIVTDHVPYEESSDGLSNLCYLKVLEPEDRTALEQFAGQGVEINELN